MKKKNTIFETKSNWESVSNQIKGQKSIELGRYVSHWFYQTPRRLLHSLSYYKFAAKMIGSGKRVLDVGCNEGLGTFVLAKECGFARGFDFDQEAIATAKRNFSETNIEFKQDDFLNSSESNWDALTSFDVIEHIYPENIDLMWNKVASSLTEEGVAIIGTPSLISQQFASEISKKGHVNIYTGDRLESEMRKVFTHVFIFSAHDEVIHTGYQPLAHYFIAIGCKKKC